MKRHAWDPKQKKSVSKNDKKKKEAKEENLREREKGTISTYLGMSENGSGRIGLMSYWGEKYI